MLILLRAAKCCDQDWSSIQIVCILSQNKLNCCWERCIPCMFRLHMCKMTMMMYARFVIQSIISYSGISYSACSLFLLCSPIQNYKQRLALGLRSNIANFSFSRPRRLNTDCNMTQIKISLFINVLQLVAVKLT